jgi:signal transduction protein with GAF and PtsI domain
MAERDARVRELVNDHQQHVALVTKTFTDNLAIQRQEFTKSLEVQRHSYAAMVERVGGHCKDELAQVTEAYRREHDRIIEAHDQFYALLDNRFARSKGKAGEGVP